MTCVWNSLIAGLRDEDMRRVLSVNKSQAQAQPHLFVDGLKRVNRPTPNVRWQGQPLTSQELKENTEWIRDYNAAGIGGGHLTSSSDPFMHLVSEVFGVSIRHNYQGHEIRFDPPQPKYTVRVCSSRGHMSAC